MRIKSACRKIACLTLSAALLFTGVLANPVTSSAASMKVSLTTTNTKITYDGGRAYTMYKKVSYKSGGKKYTRQAFCLEPDDAVPSNGTYTAYTVADRNDLSRCLYHADGAPGESDFRSFMKKNNLSSYISSTNQYYAFMHIVTAYAYDSSTAFKIWGGGTLSGSYRNAVKKAYKFCQENVPNVDFGFEVVNNSNTSSKVVKATYNRNTKLYTSGTFRVTGNAEQTFSYTVPKGFTMYLKNTTSASSYTKYIAGKSPTVKRDARFYFVIDPSKANTKTTYSKTVKGDYSTLDTWRVSVKSSQQNVGFFTADSSESATFKITFEAIPAEYNGKIKIAKATKSLEGSVEPESGAVFQIYNSSFSSYDAAVAASTTLDNYAAKLTTGSDGTATSVNLHANPSSAKGNTYKVVQISGKTGYKLAETKTVTVTNGNITLVKDTDENYILNEQYPLKIKIKKVDAGTGELITSGTATFDVYEDSAYTEKIETITTEGGIAVSKHLDPGTYYLKEVSAPSGYNINKKIPAISIGYDNASLSEADDTYYLTTEVEDTRITTHDIVVKKTAEGGLWEAALSGTASASESLKNEKFTFKAYFTGLEPGASYTYTGGSFTADSSGNATVTFNITGTVSSGTLSLSTVTFSDIPSNATYRIEEVGQNYLGGSQKYTASYNVTLNKKAVKVPSKTGNPGEGISTGTETFPDAAGVGISDDNYNVEYTFNNSIEIKHKLIIKKNVAGLDASSNDVFSYTVTFKNLKLKNSKYTVPGYSVCRINDEGEKEAVASAEETTSTSSTVSFSIDMKDGYILEFPRLDAGASYSICEEANDYLPSYKKYVYATGTSPGDTPVSTRTGASSNIDFVLAELSSDAISESETPMTIQYDVTNTMEEEVGKSANRLVIEKITGNGNTTDTFGFNVSISGLKPQELYPFIIVDPTDPRYTTSYKLSANGFKFALENTETGGSLGFCQGISVGLIRSDGKAKYMKTDEDGVVDFSSDSLKNWVQKKGSSITVTWVGGEIPATVSSSGITYSDSAMNAALLEHIGTIRAFRASDTGTFEGGLSAAISSGRKIIIDGLPEGAHYTVTESANAYRPSYTGKRLNLMTGKESDLGSNSTTAGGALTTDKANFPSSGTYVDTVTFMNDKDAYDLTVSKMTTNNSVNEFSFGVELSNLSEASYYAMVPGDGVYDISISESGDIAIIQTNGSIADFSDLPITITRSDGKKLIVKPNAAGIVTEDKYVSWLTESGDKSITFKITFLDKEIEMACSK